MVSDRNFLMGIQFIVKKVTYPDIGIIALWKRAAHLPVRGNAAI